MQHYNMHMMAQRFQDLTNQYVLQAFLLCFVLVANNKMSSRIRRLVEIIWRTVF